MAAIGRTARTQIVQLCAARNHVRVAGFRTTSQAVLDQSLSTSVAWEGYSVTCPAWCREMLPVYSRGFATRDGADKVTGAGKTSSGEIEEEMRVDAKVRDELGEHEGDVSGVKDKAKQAVSKVGEKVKDAGKAIEGSTDSKTVNKVGDTVKGAGDTIKDKGAKKQTLGKEDVVTS